MTVEGEPPYKDRHFSIRNTRHPVHVRFLKLREMAANAMNGRMWCNGAVGIKLTVSAPKLQKGLTEYMGGIMDTLDGSHGYTFTYLPIVYQDDCQVTDSEAEFIESKEVKYQLVITFLD